jgi:hypothetical protein
MQFLSKPRNTFGSIVGVKVDVGTRVGVKVGVFVSVGVKVDVGDRVGVFVFVGVGVTVFGIDVGTDVSVGITKTGGVGIQPIKSRIMKAEKKLDI